MFLLVDQVLTETVPLPGTLRVAVHWAGKLTPTHQNTITANACLWPPRNLTAHLLFHLTPVAWRPHRRCLTLDVSDPGIWKSGSLGPQHSK